MQPVTRPRVLSLVLRNLGIAIAGATALATLHGGQVHAQWGFGYGFNFNQPREEVSFLNQRSLALTNRATMGPVQNNVYANNPNSFVNQLRAPGYLDRYDIETRRSIESSIGRYSTDFPTARRPSPPPTQNNPTAVATAPAPPASPELPISSFFDRYSKLVWPGVAPTWGDLADKRNTSDLASLAVLNEYNLRGLASLTTVNDARTKLLDYGRPALEYVRQNSTPRLADTFHMFLLSLYESLAQAAIVPKPATAPAGNTTPAPGN